MIYTITANPAVDCIMHVRHLEVGITNRSEWEEISFGGKGINVSSVLTRLGIPNVAWGFIAGFTGEALKNSLMSEGVSCDFIPLKHGNTRINAKLKGLADESSIVGSNVETGINSQGPDIDPEALDALFVQLSQTQPGDILVVSGGVPKNVERDLYARIIQSQESKDVRVVVDATGELLLKALPHRPFLIKPNNEEVAEIFGCDRDDVEELSIAARKLQQMGARNVLLSQGAQGALLLTDEGQILRADPIPGELVNSVGAGDSMVAGFLAGLSVSYEHAFALGMAAGAATAFSQELATKEEIERLVKRVHIEQIACMIGEI